MEIESKLGPDDAELAPVLELAGWCTSDAALTVGLWTRALAIRTATGGALDPRTTQCRFTLAMFHQFKRHPALAVEVLEPVLATYADDVSADPQIAPSLGLLGSTARATRRFDVAEKAFRASLARIRRTETGRELAIALHNLGGFLVDRAPDEARALLDECVRVTRDLADVTPDWLPTISVAFYELGDLDAAEAAHQLGRERGVNQRLVPAPGTRPPLIFDLPEGWRRRTGDLFSHMGKEQYNLRVSVRRTAASDRSPAELARAILAGGGARDGKIELASRDRALAHYRPSGPMVELVAQFEPPKDDHTWVLVETVDGRTSTAVVSLSVLKNDADADETDRLVHEVTRSLSAAEFPVEPTE